MYTVLLVDDEPRAVEGLQLFVDWEALGFRVCGICDNGEEALDAIGRLHPDVVVTDIRMPGMDGLELIGTVRRREGPSPEFVILSGYSEFAYAKRALQLGVCHYLLKPVIREEAAEVLGRIRQRLEPRRGQTALPISGGSPLPAEAVRQAGPILEAIERLNGPEAEARIRALFAEIGDGSPGWDGIFVSHLHFECVRILQEMGGDPSRLMQVPETHPGTSPTLDRALSFARLAIAAIRDVQSSKPGSTLAEIDRYIREHYRGSLSVKGIAARFYLHPVYLGKAYQEKFGCSLLDRIHGLRIEEAKRLLRETELKTSRVAEAVGYSHYHHFLQHFEKRTGLKPGDYRTAASAPSC